MNDLNVFILSIIVSVLVVLFFVKKWLAELHEREKPSVELIEWLKDVSQQMQTSTSTVDRKLTENMNQFNLRLDKAAQVIAAVQRNIGEFAEIGRSMKQIQELLQSPKLRGNIGEQVLKNLLEQFLPNSSYSLQYSFKNGMKVDAVVKTSHGLIPIDAKFPLEGFKKMISAQSDQERKQFKKEFEANVKGHVLDISKKYVRVEEGTVDYALMYVPSESVYYEVINSQQLYDYASEKRVLMVSPMSFYAYIKVILMSLEGQKIEERAAEILSVLKSLRKDYENTDQALSVLHKHLTNAYSQLSNVSKHFVLFGQRLQSTTFLEQRQEKQSSSERETNPA